MSIWTLFMTLISIIYFFIFIVIFASINAFYYFIWISYGSSCNFFIFVIKSSIDISTGCFTNIIFSNMIHIFWTIRHTFRIIFNIFSINKFFTISQASISSIRISTSIQIFFLYFICWTFR